MPFSGAGVLPTGSIFAAQLASVLLMPEQHWQKDHPKSQQLVLFE